MSRVWPLLMYKIRFFFGPSLRGRFGPLAYLGLTLLFGLYGFGIGSSIAGGLQGAPPAQGIGVLSSPLAALLAIGILYGIFSGVTAHVSEFDFFMTADLRPREYLVSDLLFQFVSVLGAGGLAAVIAAFGMVASLHRPLWTAFPFVSVLFAFLLFVFLGIQLIAILRVRYPKAHVPAIAAILLVLSLLPAISLIAPSFPVRFQGLPMPPAVFATLGYEILMGLPVDLVNLAVAAATFAVVAGLWLAVSDTYIFHGIHPSLSAGFGQVDMAARMAQQQRLTARVGRLTSGITVRSERGSDTGYMARYHLLRILRDGSILFIAIFGVIAILPVQATGPIGGAQDTPTAILATQMLGLLTAMLALNWSYYERPNTWIVVVAARSLSAYFRGLMISFVAVGLVIAATILAMSWGAAAVPPSLLQVALPAAGAVAAGLAAAVLLTRVKVQLSAFSLGMFAILFLVDVAGFVGGVGAYAVLLAAEFAVGLNAAFEAILLLAYCVGIAALGVWWLGRLAPGFRL